MKVLSGPDLARVGLLTCIDFDFIALPDGGFCGALACFSPRGIGGREEWRFARWISGPVGVSLRANEGMGFALFSPFWGDERLVSIGFFTHGGYAEMYRVSSQIFGAQGKSIIHTRIDAHLEGDYCAAGYLCVWRGAERNDLNVSAFKRVRVGMACAFLCKYK